MCYARGSLKTGKQIGKQKILLIGRILFFVN